METCKTVPGAPPREIRASLVVTGNLPFVLWGSPHSFYTGKIRSYLIKKGVPYREEFPFNPQFQARVLAAVRLLVVPILETPDGRILQDTTYMIECIEAEIPSPSMIPESPVQKAVAWLLGAFGSEGLLAPGKPLPLVISSGSGELSVRRNRVACCTRGRIARRATPRRARRWNTSMVFCRFSA